MLSKPLNKQNIIVGSIIVLAGLSRLWLHIPNFTAIGAMCLFSGAIMTNRFSGVFAPLLALLVTDGIMALQNGGLYADYLTGSEIWINYLLFATYAGFGLLMRQSNSFLKNAGGAIGASVAYFLLSNFHVWLTGHGMAYPRSFAGLMECYAAGLPFFRGTFFSDMLFSATFFGLNSVLVRRFAV